jgi:hypothetical protein
MRTGISLYQQNPDGSMSKPLQLPSWTSAGRLGGFVVDQLGNIFVVPVPNVNTLENPPEKQNWMYKIDSVTGELEVFTKLPVSVLPSQLNPYGLLGLAYDCSNKLLYVTSVSGSSADKEIGKVFIVDATSGTIFDSLHGIDALGIGIAVDAGKPWAYLGKARSSEIVRVALTPKGLFENKTLEAVTRIDLFDKLRARKIRSSSVGIIISTTEFYYNLIAQTEFEQPTLEYDFRNRRLRRLQ